MSVGASLRAATIFDNSTGDLLHRFAPPTLLLDPTTTYEVGDQIILAGTQRWLTGFDFEYWAANSAPGATTFAGTVQAQVKIYLNDGALVPPGGPPYGYASPSTVLYDSGLFSLDSALTTRRTEVFTLADFRDELPIFIGVGLTPASELTWSVQFSGLGLGDSVGLDIYSPPTIGDEYTDYWQNNGGWSLLTNTVPMDFGARFYAESTIPEPSMVTLSIMGGLGILTVVRRLRRKE